jgi:hypothetical protein
MYTHTFRQVNLLHCQYTLSLHYSKVSLPSVRSLYRYIVCILLGCSVLVILRAYVYNHMEGDIFAGKTNEEIE